MPTQLTISVEDVKTMINGFSPEEKAELAHYLDRITLRQRLKAFIQSNTKIPLTIEEITAETEIVRAERHATSAVTATCSC